MFKRLHGLVLFVYCIIISIIPSLSGKNQGALSEEKTFTIYDADDSGGIGRKELECLFSDRSITEDLDAWTSEILYQHINDRYDGDQNGALDRSEFAVLFKDMDVPIVHQGNQINHDVKTPAFLFEQGLYFYHGKVKNLTEAARLFTLAADAGHPKAQHALGVMNLLGQEVIRNESEALRLFRLAALQGNTDSMLNLGSRLISRKSSRSACDILRNPVRNWCLWLVALLRGAQPPSEHDEGVKWLASASAAGISDAQRVLMEYGYGPDGVLLKIDKKKSKKKKSRHKKKKKRKRIDI